jgi:PAS domain S-box-containing protein
MPPRLGLTDGKPGGSSVVGARHSEPGRDADSFEQLVRTVPAGLWRSDPSGHCSFVNERWCQITGWSAAEAAGNGWVRILHTEDAPRVVAAWREALRRGGEARIEYRICTPEGAVRWVFGHAVPERDARGKILGYAGSLIDITDGKRTEGALRESEDRYRRLVESTPDAIVVESEARCVFANSALVTLLGGTTVAEFVGVSPVDWIHPDFRARFEERRRRPRVDGKEPPVFEARILRRDGGSEDVELATLPFVHEGKPATLMIFRDISRRKRALEALRESENLFRQVVDSGMVGIFFWDLRGNITYANSAFLKMIGFTLEDVLAGRVRWKDLTPPEYEPLDRAALRELAETGVFNPFEKEYLLPGGRRVPILIGGALLPGSSESGVSFCLDVTQRYRIERDRDRLFIELRQAHDRLRVLSRGLVEIQEAERRRIARELHDEVGQELTALKLLLQQSQTRPAGSLSGSLQSVDRVLSLVRDMSLELRPTMLDDLGLAPALHWQCDRHTALGRVRVELRHNGVEGRRFPSEIETAAYRIVQEALTNVVRHSRARRANVRLWANGEQLTVQIEDPGRGFDVEAALSTGMSSGLSGMRERVALLGGRFSLESTPGSGTHLTAELPLQVHSKKIEGVP